MEMDDIHIEYSLKINVKIINSIMKYENKKVIIIIYNNNGFF